MNPTLVGVAIATVLLLPAMRWLTRWAPWAIEAEDAELAREPIPEKPSGMMAHYRQPLESSGWAWDVLAIALACLVVTQHAGARGFALAGLSLLLVVLARIDFRTLYLPDSLTQVVLWSGLLAAAAGLTVSTQDAIYGAALGYGFPWLIFHVYRIIRGVEGMGFGDFKLLAGLGAWGGWLAVPYIILGAAILGSVIYGLRISRGKAEVDQEFPFGPYIAASGWIWLTAGARLQPLLGI